MEFLKLKIPLILLVIFIATTPVTNCVFHTVLPIEVTQDIILTKNTVKLQTNVKKILSQNII